jgi:hypothetical protein
MPKVREILCHVAVEIAEKKRMCHRNRAQHAIVAGAACLVVFGGTRRARKNYCLECGRIILEQARQDLARLSAELSGPRTCVAPRLPL